MIELPGNEKQFWHSRKLRACTSGERALLPSRRTRRARNSESRLALFICPQRPRSVALSKGLSLPSIISTLQRGNCLCNMTELVYLW
jgi:hypothetical protein